MSKERIVNYLKICILAALIGLLVGLVMLLFNRTIDYLTLFRNNHHEIIYMLPVGGLLIILIYRYLKITAKAGSEMVFRSMQYNEPINSANGIAVFIASLLSHLFGASAGKTNASLQIGGVIADELSSLFKLTKRTRRYLILCGLSAAVATLFATPLAAAFLAVEVTTIGHFYYKALFPCSISALVAYAINQEHYVIETDYVLKNIPEFNAVNIILVIIIGIICAIIAIIFCMMIHYMVLIFNKINNKYLKILISGCLLIILYAIFGNEYAGSGNDLITLALKGNVVVNAFIIKMLVSAISTAGGYQGGMVSPTLASGACLGICLSRFIDLDPSFCMAICMIALFVGVINAKGCALIMAVEMFGINAILYYIIVIIIADQLSLNFKIFNAQEFESDKMLIAAVKRIKNRLERDKDETFT